MEPYHRPSVNQAVERDAKNARTRAALVSPDRCCRRTLRTRQSRTGAALVSRQETLCAGRQGTHPRTRVSCFLSFTLPLCIAHEGDRAVNGKAAQSESRYTKFY